MSNNAVINRSLTTVRNELEFLKDSNVITNALYEQLSSHLPSKYNGGAPVDTIGSGAVARTSEPEQQLAPPTSPHPYGQSQQQGEIVEAMYDLQGREPSDLSLFRGQQILVLQKINEGWWRGRDTKSGAEGVFPSNYVRPVSSSSPMPQTQSMVPMNNSPAPPYYPPQQQGYYNQPVQYQQQPYNPMMQQVQQQPQQQQVVEQPQQHQGSHEISNGVKKFGSKLGNAAIFGAGATMGSNLVNSIF